MNKLPEPFKTDWIKALRSGEYKQGIGRMYCALDNTFCCLGVAEHICGTEACFMNRRMWPKSIVKPNSLLGDKDPEDLAVLSTMNDTGRSFSEIADYIEQNL